MTNTPRPPQALREARAGPTVQGWQGPAPTATGAQQAIPGRTVAVSMPCRDGPGETRGRTVHARPRRGRVRPCQPPANWPRPPQEATQAWPRTTRPGPGRGGRGDEARHLVDEGRRCTARDPPASPPTWTTRPEPPPEGGSLATVRHRTPNRRRRLDLRLPAVRPNRDRIGPESARVIRARSGPARARSLRSLASGGTARGLAWLTTGNGTHRERC